MKMHQAFFQSVKLGSKSVNNQFRSFDNSIINNTTKLLTTTTYNH